MFARLATAAAIVCLAPSAALASMPEIFHKDGYEKAKTLATEQGKYLIVDFTAVWCGPCKRMDKDTWVDDSVTAWIREHAVAVQVDVDEQRDVAQAYNVGAMPTVIVVKNGEEFDRQVGYKSPQALLGWFDTVQTGRSSTQILRESLEGDDLQGPALVRAKWDLAKVEVNAGNLDAATDLYAWLWNNCLELDMSMAGVRGSFLLGEITRLMAKHPPAKERFEAIRAEAWAGVQGRKSLQALDDWADLSVEFGHADEVLAWYDAHKESRRDAKAIDRISWRLQDLFIENGRWADLGHTLQHPAEMFGVQANYLTEGGAQAIDESMREEMLGYMREQVDHQAKQYHTALLAADREADAFRVANVYFKTSGDDGPLRLALVRHALDAGFPHAKHAAWCDEAGDPELAGRVRAALGGN